MAEDAKDELKALVVRARQEKQGPFPETLDAAFSAANIWNGVLARFRLRA